MDRTQPPAGRDALEAQISADLRALSAESDRIGRLFAALHQLRGNDFQALLHVLVAETAGEPLTSGELGQRLGLSAAAITYLVDRMIESGHLRRVADAADRRKVILRYADHGMDTARAFFTPLGSHIRTTLADLPEADLSSAHRVFTAVTEAMRNFQADLDAR